MCIRDRSLRAYLSYILFAPAIVAGPIDRAERFLLDYQNLPLLRAFDPARWGLGLWRIGQGLFKKFVIADTLAQRLSLTPTLAAQTEGAGALWPVSYTHLDVYKRQFQLMPCHRPMTIIVARWEVRTMVVGVRKGDAPGLRHRSSARERGVKM